MSSTDIQSEHKGKKVLASISTAGAELQSLRVVQKDPAQIKEYLWQGDPEVWAGRAPVLFPIVGALRHSPNLHRQGQIDLKQHGFARRSDFELLQATENGASFRLQANKETLKVYPWQFQLDAIFHIRGPALSVCYQLTNTDKSEMLFNIGSHPAFQLATSEPGGALVHSDYSIEFEQQENLQLHGVLNGGLLTVATTPYPLASRSIALTKTIFDHDALVFRNINSRRITLAHKTQGRILTVDTGGAPHLGLWAKPGAKFVCIEPWWGHADFDDAGDQLADKASIQKLAPGERFETTMTIEPHI